MSKKPKPKALKEKITPPDKPLEPQFWFIVGAALLIVGGCIYFDPISFSEAGPSNSDMWLRDILVIIVGIFGKNPTAIIVTGLALFSFGWGLWGWLAKRDIEK